LFGLLDSATIRAVRHRQILSSGRVRKQSSELQDGRARAKISII
jgi:hypothetical protein